jgi:hypothetical protein
MFGGETPMSDDKSNILDAYTTIAAQFFLLILAGSLPFWMLIFACFMVKSLFWMPTGWWF